MLDLRLDAGVAKFFPNQSLRVEHRPPRIAVHLRLCRISNETFRICKRHIRRRGSVSLIVGDNVNLTILVDTDAAIGGSKVNSDSETHSVSYDCKKTLNEYQSESDPLLCDTHLLLDTVLATYIVFYLRFLSPQEVFASVARGVSTHPR